MINNNTIRNCTAPFPVVQGLVNDHVLGKILIKNVYQGWQGETIKEISEKHLTNPYSLRIGTPATDEAVRGDRMYFIPEYMAYNPLTKEIEKRELVSHRHSSTVYIGQSVDEKIYKNYKLFVDGNVVVNDIVIKRFEDLQYTTVGEVLVDLMNRIEKLQSEIVELKRQSNSRHIYTQGTL
jgi:uncharacterized transporter YbjL